MNTYNIYKNIAKSIDWMTNSTKVDPWHWESTLVGEDPTVDAIFVKGASHCEWMHAVKPGMPGGIQEESGPGGLRCLSMYVYLFI